ncbi:MAG: immune inhibitor A domain-containing protein, partial [Anaerolineales bacterium]
MRSLRTPVYRLISLLGLAAMILSSAGAPALAAPAEAPQARPAAAVSSSFAVGWIFVYKFAAPQPVCTGSAIASDYYSGEDCGFGAFTISPNDGTKTIDVNFRGADGSIFLTEVATYNALANPAPRYEVDVTPDNTWPIGPITLEAVMRAPDTGSATIGIFLNTLVVVCNQSQAQYAPGNTVAISGTVSRRIGPSLSPVDAPVNAGVTARLVDPDTAAILATQTTTATLGGAWSVTFPGGSTAAFTTKNYKAVIDAAWTDNTAVFGPDQWHGRLNLVSPFSTGPANLLFNARETATNGTVHAGQTYLTVISISNTTALPASGVVVTAVLASGAVYLGGSTLPPANSGSGTAGSPLTWNVGSVPAGSEARIYLYTRAKNTGEDPTIVWQLLDLRAGVSYTHNSLAKTASDTTLGPKVVPEGEVGDTVRHGQRPFPVALVDYVDIKHDAANSGSYFKDEVFPVVIDRYTEMSMGQLLPVPVLPGVGRGDVRYDQTPGATYKWAPLAPAGFCSGATTGTGTTPPAGATYRIQNEWYQLPGTQGFYGSDSTVSNYAGALSGQGALVNVDNGCGAPGKIAYDAATLMDPDIDYNDFDSDRDGWVDFFELVYAGQPENIIGETGVNNVWPHSSSLAYYYPGGYISHDQLRNHQDQLEFWTDASESAMTTTPTAFPVYVKVGPYNVNAEFSGQITFSHEYGHSLGLPDNYSLGTRNTMDDWDLMSSGEGHMSLWDKQELGWIVPQVISSSLSAPAQKELKIDTHSVKWYQPNGTPYTLTGNVHNADVYKVNLPKVQLFDPAIIPSGAWVYYSGSGNDFGYPGHVFDLNFDGSLTNGASDVHLQFRSWY